MPVPGHIWFVLSRAKRSSIIPASDTQALVSTNIKCDAGEIEESLCSRIQLAGVIVLLVSIVVN